MTLSTTSVWQPGKSFLAAPSTETFSERLSALQAAGKFPPAAAATLLAWKKSYTVAASKCASVGASSADQFSERAFFTLLHFLIQHAKHPIDFQPYHQGLPELYAFGLDFAMALVDIPRSRLIGQDNLRKAHAWLQQGHNVVFLSNHQSEADPYAIDALFTIVGGFPKDFARKLIFMAGDRVREDPIVVPFSGGRDLLTVYSKKHLNDVPELRATKVAHNRRTIFVTQKLFAAGGKAIWFAPSGGRDRRSPDSGKVEVSPFDPDAIEMMRFTAKKSGTPCHFIPMSLVSYDMLPPPSGVGGADMGEERVVNHIGLSMAVEKEIDFSQIDTEGLDKLQRRRRVATTVQEIVENGYANIGGYDI